MMQPALGQTDFCDQKESQLINTIGYSVAAIEALDTIDCLGRNRDQNSTIKKIRVITQDKELLRIDLNSLSAIDELSEIAGLIQGPNVTKIKDEINELQNKFKIDGPLNNSVNVRLWEFNHPWIVEAKTKLSASCSNIQTTVCQSDYINTKNIIRVVNSVANILNYKSEPLKSEVATLFRKRVNMWEDYVDEALPQWPWEYKFTGMINPDNRKKDENDQPIGPRKLPNLQFRALHLTTGLAAIDTQDNSFAPVVYAELIGINKLFWDEDRGRLKGGLGASLIAAYTPEAEDSLSYGVMFHVQNKYSLAVVKNDDDYGVVASVDLVSFFQKGWAKKYLQKELPDIGRLIN